LLTTFTTTPPVNNTNAAMILLLAASIFFARCFRRRCQRALRRYMRVIIRCAMLRHRRRFFDAERHFYAVDALLRHVSLS